MKKYIIYFILLIILSSAVYVYSDDITVLPESYDTYQEMKELLQKRAIEYPDIMVLEDIGDSWEKANGYRDYDIWAVKLYNTKERKEKPKSRILIIGGIDGSKPISVEIVLSQLDYLLNHYGNDKQITILLNEIEFWFIPMLNPDGISSTHRGLSWSCNGNDIDGNAYLYELNDGVDLNRNFDWEWNNDIIDEGNDRLYNTGKAGEKPFSEPETQAIRDLVDNISFDYAISYHSMKDRAYIFFPYIYPDGTISDDVDGLFLLSSMMMMMSFQLNKTYQAIYGSALDANERNWLYAQGIYTFSIGVLDFPYAEIEMLDSICRENLTSFLYLAEYVKENGKILPTAKNLEKGRYHPIQNDYLLFKAHNCEMGGEFDLAISYYKELLQIEPQNAEAMNDLAYLYALQNTNIDEAIYLSEKANKLVPNDGNYLDTLGWLYYLEGKYQSAYDVLTRAAKLVGAIEIYDHLAETCIKLGRIDEAIAVWKVALTIGGGEYIEKKIELYKQNEE